MRLFIATSFPTEVLDDLNARVSRLRPRLPAASWVRPEAQHVTFAFLAEQPESLVDTLAPALTEALRSVASFEASLSGSGFFPNPRHARVGWIGLQPESPFIAIAQIVRGVVTKNGVELDGADFKPHLTLMRIRDRWPPASIELFNQSLRDYRSSTFNVAEVTLFSSELNPKGAIHTPVKKFALSSP
jgi:RNA 2',3'-cyclic 3'-phosphodiesterase